MLTTPRLGISYPDPDRHDRPDIPLHLKNLATILDTSTIFGQGLLADRPPSTVASHGIQGRFYMQTDSTPHILWWDNGTGWDPVGFLADGSVGTVTLADGSVTTVKLGDLAVTSAKIANGAVGTLQIADNSITAAKLVDGIVPSRGALGSTEALRSIGPNPGQVLGGDDPRIPSAGQSGAMAGSSGTPSASNPYVTQSDVTHRVYILAAPDPFDISNDNSERDIINYTVGGGAMAAKGELMYRMHARFTHPSLGSGTVMTFKLYLAGTLIGQWICGSSGSNGGTALGYFIIYVRNYGQTSAQRVYVDNSTPGFGGAQPHSVFTPAINTNADMNFRVTCTQAAKDTSHALEIWTHYLELRRPF